MLNTLPWGKSKLRGCLADSQHTKRSHLCLFLYRKRYPIWRFQGPLLMNWSSQINGFGDYAPHLPANILWTCLMSPINYSFVFSLCPHFLMFLHNFGCELLCGEWSNLSTLLLLTLLSEAPSHLHDKVKLTAPWWEQIFPRDGAWGLSQTAHDPLRAWLCLSTASDVQLTHTLAQRKPRSPHRTSLGCECKWFLHQIGLRGRE